MAKKNTLYQNLSIVRTGVIRGGDATHKAAFDALVRYIREQELNKRKLLLCKKWIDRIEGKHMLQQKILYAKLQQRLIEMFDVKILDKDHYANKYPK